MGADIHVENHFVVSQLLDRLVHLQNLAAPVLNVFPRGKISRAVAVQSTSNFSAGGSNVAARRKVNRRQSEFACGARSLERYFAVRRFLGPPRIVCTASSSHSTWKGFQIETSSRRRTKSSSLAVEPSLFM